MRKEVYTVGEMNERVTFRRPDRTADGMGGNALTWATVQEVWAHVRPMSGNEREHSDRLNAEGRYLIVTHNRSDIDETCVADWRGHRLNLRFVKRRPMSRFIEIEADMGVAA